jgi:diaminopimelate epimerase
MSTRTLQKWHGAGNDFLVDVLAADETSTWTPELARRICHRTQGLGADGLLVAQRGDVVTMTLYNADGSVAEMSGNGIRCLVAAVRRAEGPGTTTTRVATLAGERLVALTLRENGSGSGSVAMGPVTLAEPLAGTLGVAYVGNPHVVVLDDATWSDRDREERAAAWADALGGANVEFVQVLDAGHVAMRVIERGVGWTQACGTGSCSIAAVCHAAGLTGNDVIVSNPGGDLHVTFDEQGAVLEGPVQFVATVAWSV